MSASTATTQATDAQRWQELQTLLHRKAYKSMTPAEIAAELPDLRALARQVQAQTKRQQGGKIHVTGI